MKSFLSPYGIVIAIIVAAIAFGFFETGSQGYTKLYDKNLTQHPPACLSLSLVPDDKSLRSALKKSYPFSPNCPYRLSVSFKQNIHCNSNQNSDRKALSAFPNSFLRMEIRRGMRAEYSYYIDLTRPANSGDILDGFEKIKKDLNL